MKKIVTLGVLVLACFLALPSAVWAGNNQNGSRLKIKDAKVLQVIPEKGTLVVEKKGNIYNIVLALGDSDKMEFLSKYGVNINPWKLTAGDHVTCRGRNFPAYFVPSKCRVEKNSDKDLYKDKKGIMVADVLAVDEANGLIVAAHSLGIVTIKVGDTKITEDGERRSLGKIQPYWRLKIKGEWDKENQLFRRLDYIRVMKRLKSL
ncbi:MAG: hypothetical protein ABIC19_00265 [Patescibacteria group bacterium]|nr:hypothetical protein [Patescibacteria group bacterium]